MKKNKFLAMALILAVGLLPLLSACAAPTPQIIEVEKEVVVEKKVIETVVVEKVVEPPPAPVTVKYWVINNDPDEELANKYAADFMATHPNIKVEVSRMGENAEETIAASLAAGTAPDIVQIGPVFAVAYSRYGALVPLDSFHDFQEAMQAAHKPADLIQSYQLGGYNYLIPWRGSPILLFYNKALLEQAGVEPPKSWDDLVAVSKAIKEKTGAWALGTEGGGLQPEGWHRMFDYLELYYNTPNKGQFLNEQGTEAIFNNADAVKTLQVFVDIHQAGAAPTSAVDEDLFSAGKAAMTFAGSWKYPVMADVGVLQPEDVGAVLIPTSDGTMPSYTYGDPRDLAIFSQSKHPDEAWEFIKFMLEDESSLELMKVTGQLPVRDDLTSNATFKAYFDEHPELMIFAESIGYTVPMDMSEHIWEVLSFFSSAFQKACLGDATAQEALDEAAVQVNDILGR